MDAKTKKHRQALKVLVVGLSALLASGCGPNYSAKIDAGAPAHAADATGATRSGAGMGDSSTDDVTSNVPESVCVGTTCQQAAPLFRRDEVTDPESDERRALDEKLPYVRQDPAALHESLQQKL